MLFNSYTYLFLFLPVSLIIYFILNRQKLTLASKVWLVLASLFFYCWWNPIYLPLICGSILFNYIIGWLILRQREKTGSPCLQAWLVIGIVGNLSLLGYFKYTDFFFANFASLSGLPLKLLHIALPLGISFFTFTQIAYLVDVKRGGVKEYSLANYSLFVTFFPHLLAGPILHHKEMMPQFDRPRNKVVDFRNISSGLTLFFIGLFKKVVIADTFALWANTGFGDPGSLTLLPAWITSVSYTLQIYFDFSGYTDMALGSARMFNIRLPINFDSPYASTDIQVFWRRWHMTLGRFIKDYIYIPLGGNRVSDTRTIFNLLLTFFLVGLWHGAGWTFVIWGLLHGAGLCIHRVWKKFNFTMPSWLGWFLTFNFVNAAFVFFRAKDIPTALSVLKAMVCSHGITIPAGLQAKLGITAVTGPWVGGMGNWRTILMMFALFLPLSALWKNSNKMAAGFKPDTVRLVFVSIIAFIAILFLGSYSEFLYFRF